MKKLLLSLLVLALVAPAMAVVNFGVVNNANGTATITINTNGAVVRGVALVVTCTGGAKLVDLSYTANAEFNTFIDYFAVTGFGEVTGETPNQEGHPFSLTGAAPGVAAVNDTTFGVTMGVLDGLGAQGGFSSTTAVDLITINTGAGNVCVSLEADNRGGVVGDVALTTNLPVCQDITAGTVSCRDMLTAAEQTYYDRYVAAGQDPSCWCWQYHCHGDGDNATQTVFLQGTFRIYNNDLNAVINNWKKTVAGGADPKADVSRSEQTVFLQGTFAIYNADLNVVITNWKKTDAQLTNCPQYLP